MWILFFSILKFRVKERVTFTVSSPLIINYHQSSIAATLEPPSSPLPTQQRACRWQITFKTLDEESESRIREIDSAKEDLLAKAKTGKGQWKEELASQSESMVKAERSEIETNEETIRKLQEETKRATVLKKQ
jgi:hypothetical protein